MHHPHRGAGLKIRFFAALLLAVSPVAAQALGLGNMVVQSGLDEPLNGQIEIISPTASELKTLKVSLASREDFDIAGVDRLPLLFDFKYMIAQAAGGKHVIKVTTEAPIREPFVHFLIQVEWNGGKLIREYSALLDPPRWSSGAPTDISAPEIATAEAMPAGAPAPSAPAPAETAAPPSSAVETLPSYEELPPIGTEPSGSQTTAAGETAQPEAPALAQVEPVTPAGQATTDLAAGSSSTSESAAQPLSGRSVSPEGVSQPVEPAAPPTEQALSTQAEPAVAGVETGMPGATQTASEYGPVQRGETLSGITQKIAIDKSLTSQQVMISL